jgi:hypothetical protein
VRHPAFTRASTPAYAWLAIALAATVLPAVPRSRALAEPSVQPTLAVVETDKELGPLADLLTAQFSQEGVQFVERKQLDAILQEQALSAAGLTDRANLVKVGQLVRADAFVLLSLEKGPEQESLIRVRIAETAHGIQLVDTFEAWDPKAVAETGRLLVGELQGAVSDLKLPPGRLTAVGVVGFHRVELPADKEWMVRAVQTMLAARLSRQPGVVVLEREDLERLREEKLLTEGEAGGLWGSAVLLEGYLQGGNGAISLVVHARRAGGEAVADVTAPVSGDDLSAAVSAVAAGLLNEIPAEGHAAQWDAESEAAAFYRKALLLGHHGRREQSIPLFETAYALQPQNEDYTLSFFGAADPKSDPIGTAERAALAIRALHREVGHVDWSRLPYCVTHSLGLLGYVCSPYASEPERAAELNRENRRQMRELLKQEPFASFASDLWAQWFVRLDRADAQVAGAAESPMIALFRRTAMPPDRGGTAASWDERFVAATTVFPNLNGLVVSSDPLELAPEFLEYLEGLVNDPDPIVRFFACRQLVNATSVYDRPPLPGGVAVDRDACKRDMARTFITDLLGRGRISREAASGMLREVVTATLDVGSPKDKPTWLDMLEKLYEPLIQKGDVETLALAIEALPGPVLHTEGPPEDHARLLALLDRTRETLLPQVSDTRAETAVRQVSQLILGTEGYWRVRLHAERDSEMVERIKAAIPRLAAEQLESRPPVRILLSKEDWPASFDKRFSPRSGPIAVDLVDGVLWVCMARDQSVQDVRLAGVDLKAGQVAAAWHASFGEPAQMTALGVLGGIAVRADKTYVAAGRRGLIEFPGSLLHGRSVLRQPRVLTEEDGLPSRHVTGVAPYGDKLYVAYGGYREESGLGVYDPDARRFETLFCSTLETGLPLSNGHSYVPLALRSAPDGLYFSVYSSEKEFPSGLWKWNAAARQAELCVGCLPNGGASCREDANGELLVSDWTMVARADSQAKSLSILASRISPHKTAGSWTARDAPFWRGACSPTHRSGWRESVLDGLLQFSSAAIAGDRMWVTCSDGRIAVIEKDKPLEESEFHGWDLLPGDEVRRFMDTPYGLAVIGSQSVGIIETEHEH